MVLCVEKKFDQNNRIFIPADFIRKAGGELDSRCYVMFDEDTKEIKIVIKKDDENEKAKIRS